MAARKTARKNRGSSLAKSAKEQAGFMLGMAKGVLPMGGVLGKNPGREADAFLAAQRKALAAEDAFSAALQQEYGKRARDMRYQYKLPPHIAKFKEAKLKADVEMRKALDAMRAVGQSVNPPWIKGAIKKPGAFRAKAKRAGKTTHQLAVEKRHAPGAIGKEARLALVLEDLRKRKRNPPVMSVTHGTRRADVHKVGKEFVTLIPGESAQGPFTSAKAAAAAGRLHLAESKKNPFRKVGKAVQKLLAKLKGKNPQDSVQDMYTMFHGLPATEVVEFREQVHQHEWLWAAGTLVSLHVKGRNGVVVKLTSPDPDETAFENVVMLALSEDGRQVYFRGGDQGLPLDELMGPLSMRDDDIRDNMVIGTITKITYRTFKSFEAGGKQPVDFWHPTGKEHSEGILPVLCYHPLDPSMFVVGGRIKVAPKSLGLGASPGIVG